MISIEFYLNGSWTLIDPPKLGIVPGPIIEKHLAEYSWSFRHVAPYDINTYQLFTPVRIKDGNTQLFVGVITKNDRIGSPSGEGITYIAESWWYAISLFTLKLDGIPRVVYNARPDDPQHDPDRYKMTVTQILADMLALVVEPGKTLQQKVSDYTLANFKQVWPGFILQHGNELIKSTNSIPPKTILDSVNLREAIKLVIKWSPDLNLRIDRANGTFYFQRRENSTVHNITLNDFDNPADSSNLSAIKINPRLDLVVPRIKLYFPVRVEVFEGWYDTSEFLSEPDGLLNIPLTITQLDDLRYQCQHKPVNQHIEVVGAGDYIFSLTSGIVTFKNKPSAFYIRNIAEESQQEYDTGYGGTGYTDYNIQNPIVERYLQDFPILTRRFWVLARDNSGGQFWLLSPDFAQAYPDPVMWPDLIGKTTGDVVTTIAQIAIHQFDNIGFNGIVSLNGIAIRTASANGYQQGGQMAVTVEDHTAAISALADGLWKALRDVRWDAELPTFRWMPELELSHRANLLNTNDPKMESMNEIIRELNFDLNLRRTRIILAANPYLDLDDLLRVLKEAMPAQNFQSSVSGSGGSPGGLKNHKHNNSSDGGSDLNPKRFAMNGATLTNDEIHIGPDTAGTNTGMKLSKDRIIFGDYPSGDYTRLQADLFEIRKNGKSIVIGIDQGQLEIQIDSLKYLFTHDGKRKLSAKVK